MILGVNFQVTVDNKVDGILLQKQVVVLFFETSKYVRLSGSMSSKSLWN